MSDRRKLGVKEFFYFLGAIGALGSLSWLFGLASVVQAGKRAEDKVEVIEPRVTAVETKTAVLEAKMDYIVTTVGKIDRKLDRDRR